MITITPKELDARQTSRLISSIVTPRPIAWVSTLSPDGIPNLAPFSFFNLVAGSPPTVMISISQRGEDPKDTLRNIAASGEFVINMVDEAHLASMNLSSKEWAYETSEFEITGLDMEDSIEISPPLVRSAPVAMEARLSQLVPINDTKSTLILGQVVCFHIREDLLTPDNLVDTSKMAPIARLGGDSYAALGRTLTLERPKI